MDEIPAWAVKAANSVFENQPDHEISAVPAVARALVAERERAAKIAENERFSLDGVSAILIAAAIRKGE